MEDKKKLGYVKFLKVRKTLIESQIKAAGTLRETLIAEWDEIVEELTRLGELPSKTEEDTTTLLEDARTEEE